jgi:hypothetical protein
MNQQDTITKLQALVDASPALLTFSDLAFDAGYDQAIVDAVAAIESFAGPFGKTTVESFAALVRGLKA